METYPETTVQEPSISPQPPLSPIPEKPKSKIRFALFAIPILLIAVGIFLVRPKSVSDTGFLEDTPVTTSATPSPSALSSQPVTATSTNKLSSGLMVFIRGNNVWVSDKGLEKQLTSDAIPADVPFFSGFSELSYHNPQFSPDGKKLAFLKSVKSDSDHSTLLVADTDGDNVRQLVTNVDRTIPTVVWANDSNGIFYVANGGMEPVSISKVEVGSGQISEYTKFEMGSGCGGMSADPADHLAADEDIINVGGGVQIFNVSPQNDYIVMTMHCMGTDVGILDLATKQIKPINAKARGVSISPDGTTIAAIMGKSIVLFDPTGNIIQTHSTTETPQTLLWDKSGDSIYYSSFTLVKTLEPNPDNAFKIFGMSPMTFGQNSAGLWKLTLTTGQSKKVINLDAHAAKPIYASKQKLFAVVVDNSTDLYQNFDRLESADASGQYYPQVNLIEVNLTNSASTLLAEQVQNPVFSPVDLP